MSEQAKIVVWKQVEVKREAFFYHLALRLHYVPLSAISLLDNLIVVK